MPADDVASFAGHRDAGPGAGEAGAASDLDPPPTGFPFDPDQLLLRVKCREGEQAYLVQPGITIGRSPSNAICLNEIGLCWLHARVERVHGRLRVITADYRWSLTLPDGQDARELDLADGVEFQIGTVNFRCVAARVLMLPREPTLRAVEPIPPQVTAGESDSDDDLGLDDAAIDALLASTRFSCPRCSEMLLLLPGIAEFCPRCGVKLPEVCPPWEIHAPEDAATKSSDQNWLHRALAALRRAPGEESAPVPPRPATLVAYVNALLGLAQRFELGKDGDLNPAQALRYYRKAARLGNRLARLRLTAQHTAPARRDDQPRHI